MTQPGRNQELQESDGSSPGSHPPHVPPLPCTHRMVDSSGSPAPTQRPSRSTTQRLQEPCFIPGPSTPPEPGRTRLLLSAAAPSGHGPPFRVQSLLSLTCLSTPRCHVQSGAPALEPELGSDTLWTSLFFSGKWVKRARREGVGDVLAAAQPQEILGPQPEYSLVYQSREVGGQGQGTVGPWLSLLARAGPMSHLGGIPRPLTVGAAPGPGAPGRSPLEVGLDSGPAQPSVPLQGIQDVADRVHQVRKTSLERCDLPEDPSWPGRTPALPPQTLRAEAQPSQRAWGDPA
ncbi:Hypothetical predicted protein [Marmota monax]|uniref:Uncharacterized protein n=1 Tax=Marmota monax TaxID=9995 RepID=A0A5E4BIC1_MARMO|nr:hypothetical protein GHT09_005316 [Marmota monax]VTJ68790.1 Hypothetical predicted protein [Marmota monax]